MSSNSLQLQQYYRLGDNEFKLFQQLKRSHPDLSDGQLAQLIHSKKTVDEISKTAPKFSNLMQEHRICAMTAYEMLNYTDQQFIWHTQPTGRYKTKKNELITYLLPGRFFPKKQSIDYIVRSSVFLIEQFVQSDVDGISNGIVIVADCSDIGWHNFDVDMTKQLLQALLEALPLKIAAIYLVNAGHLVKAIMKIVKSIVPKAKYEKYLARTFMLPSLLHLQSQIDANSLPTQFGGNLQFGPPEFANFWKRLCNGRTVTESV